MKKFKQYNYLSMSKKVSLVKSSESCFNKKLVQKYNAAVHIYYVESTPLYH